MSSSEQPKDNNNEEVAAALPGSQAAGETTTTTADTDVATSTGKKFMDEYEKMVQQYGVDYIKRVAELAKRESYTITLNVPDKDGKTEPDPIDPKIMREIYVGTEQKQYKHRPISSQDYHRAEKLRGKFQNEKDPEKVADNQAMIYQFLAFCYLGMSPAEFKRVADWAELKLIVDACNHRTLYQAVK